MQILWTKEKISDLGKENGESYLGLDMRENSQWHEQMAISKTSIFYISQKGIEMLLETFFILFKYFFLKGKRMFSHVWRLIWIPGYLERRANQSLKERINRGRVFMLAENKNIFYQDVSISTGKNAMNAECLYEDRRFL